MEQHYRDNIELVDVEYKKEGKRWFLRVFIDKPGGIQLSDCEQVSRFLDAELDSLNLITHHYILEVSSPGIERHLRKPEDFVRFRGSLIEVRTNDKIYERRNFRGKIIDFSEGRVILETEEGTIDIPLNIINKANLKVF